MNDELRESIFNLIKNLESLAEVKKVLKVNDISGEAAESFIAKWSGTPKAAPAYPGKKLVIENKALDESPVEKELVPEVITVEDPEVIEEILEEAVEVTPEPAAVSKPALRFGR
jgi:hypothetical protein